MNYMKQVAEMLGVELGERFGIKGEAENYRLTQYGLIKCEEEETTYDQTTSDEELTQLLSGCKKIVKLPWKPKCGKVYYYVRADGDVEGSVWGEHTFDILCYLVGNCFHSEAEAEAHKDEMLKRMKGVMCE